MNRHDHHQHPPPAFLPQPPSFTFVPPPQPPPQNPPHHHPTTAPPNLSTVLSTLKHLINLTTTTLTSLPSTTTTPLATCPFNPHHRLPPSSLFLHSLKCPSSPSPVDPTTILPTLHYPTTLHQNPNRLFSPTDPNPETELCFSLDEYPLSNFYYQDCPGVVSFPDQNGASRMLTLPFCLFSECANFKGNEGVRMSGIVDGKKSCLSFLPSELGFVRNEISGWSDFPSFYSYGVLRLTLCAFVDGFSGLREWLIVNSTSYGVVIDVYMRDHIFVLFRLCLKAVAREAGGFMTSCGSGEWNWGKRCECPVLVRVLMWLASQLSLLYNEVNGKLFAVGIFKKCLLIASEKCVLVLNDEKVGRSPGLKEVENGKLLENNDKGESTTEAIYVSQVAAAVAALHERASLEAKIRAIRDTRRLTSYQRVAEHEFVSKRADEERRKRSNYRPVIDHDGFLWQRGSNQETNKMKSREELLAEERDYKRRRMSYRGKKIKRSTTQVMRDIIEEYMEEIKKASGTVSEAPGNSGKPASESYSVHDVSTNHEALTSTPNSIEVNKRWSREHHKELNLDVSLISRTYEDEFHEDLGKQRRDGQMHHGHKEAYSLDRSVYNQDHHFRKSDRQRSESRSHEDAINQGKRNEIRQPRRDHTSSPDRGRSRSREQRRWKDNVHEIREPEDGYQRSKYRNKGSSSAAHHEFEDRYDPSQSYESYA